MATTTTNLGLIEPAGQDRALVANINTNSEKIDAEAGKARANFALVQNGDTATQAISQGQLVVWKGTLKKATANIASGATLSSSNLTDDSIATEIASLNTKIVLLNNATRHTRKTDFSLSDLQAAVADQNLELHGLQVGDQKTINGHTYVIAGLNVMKGSHAYTCTSNHVGLIVIPHTTCKWNESGSTVKTSDGSDNRGGGYKNCDLQYYLANTVMGFCNTDLGSSHLYQHKKLFGNAVNATGYNRFGTNTGCTSEWEWVDAYISALTEAQVFGGDHWSSSGYDTGEANTLLPVFAKYKHTDIFGNEYPWLRNVSSASQACLANNRGNADGEDGVSNAYCVAGLILYH